jgi:hypothetical protein
MVVAAAVRGAGTMSAMPAAAETVARPADSTVAPADPAAAGRDSPTPVVLALLLLGPMAPVITAELAAGVASGEGRMAWVPTGAFPAVAVAELERVISVGLAVPAVADESRFGTPDAVPLWL